ncbi:MAG: porin family protein [Paludibacteraceae bacterium]|nr:porin family protein [Paludibacteraceae bacterium]
MKKLVKFSAIAAMFLFSSLAANAQIKVGINAGAQLPMGDFKDLSKTGFGGGLSGKYMLNPNMGVGLNLGYYAFDGKDQTAELSTASDTSTASAGKTKVTIIPITANFTYYFGEGALKPYAGIDLGASIMKMKNDVFGLDSTTTKFSFAPVIGVQYSFNESLALDLNVKYNCIVGGIEKETADITYDAITGEMTGYTSTTKKSMATSLGINLGLVYSFGGK